MQFRKVGRLKVAKMPNGDRLVLAPGIREGTAKKYAAAALLHAATPVESIGSRGVRKTRLGSATVFLKPIMFNVLRPTRGGEFRTLLELNASKELTAGKIAAEKPLALYIFRRPRGPRRILGYLATRKAPGKPLEEDTQEARKRMQQLKDDILRAGFKPGSDSLMGKHVFKTRNGELTLIDVELVRRQRRSAP